MSDLSEIIPTLCHIYPNGQADVNHFQAAGGMALLIRELLGAGLLHNDVKTILGKGAGEQRAGLDAYCQEPFLTKTNLQWRTGATKSLDQSIITDVSCPFSKEGGIKLLEGNLGRSIIKVSAVKTEHWIIRAEAVIFDHQDEISARFKAGELNRNFVAVVRFQDPKANGMPELHKLSPILGLLQDRGFKVTLVTDGRMSGASGKVPAVIHLTPEAVDGGPIAKLRVGDLIEINAKTGSLRAMNEDVLLRPADTCQYQSSHGMGRELFTVFRHSVGNAETGASVF